MINHHDHINGFNGNLNGSILNKKYVKILRHQIKSKF